MTWNVVILVHFGGKILCDNDRQQHTHRETLKFETILVLPSSRASLGRIGLEAFSISSRFREAEC